MPVLVAVDQYNTWEGPSVYHYKNNPVKGFDLCVPRALHFVSKKKSETERWTMANGLCVAATSMRHPEGCYRPLCQYRYCQSPYRYTLLIHTVNTPYRSSVNIYYQSPYRYTLSIHTVNTLYQSISCNTHF